MTNNIQRRKIEILDRLNKAGLNDAIKVEYDKIFQIYFTKYQNKSLKKISDVLTQIEIENEDFRYSIHILYKVSTKDISTKNSNFVFHKEVSIGDFKSDRIIFDFCDFKSKLTVINLNDNLKYLRIQKGKLKNLLISCNSIKNIELIRNIFDGDVSIGTSNLNNKMNIIGCTFYQRIRFPQLKLNQNASIVISKCSFYNFIDISSEEQFNYFNKFILNNNNWNFQNIRAKGIANKILGKIIINSSLNNSKYKDLIHHMYSFNHLNKYYLEKGLEYEATQFKRLINHIYLEKANLSKRDKFMLYSRMVSNDFETNYVRGIIFTLVFAAFFYFLLILILNIQGKLFFSFKQEDIIAFVAHFLDFMNLGKWKVNFFNLGDNNILNSILYIGRIFITFGIYQTIAAFRNSSKK